MSLRDACERTHFLLNGGVPSLLGEVLDATETPALLLRREGRDLVVTWATRFSPPSLLFSDSAALLEKLFPPCETFPAAHTLATLLPEETAEFFGDVPWSRAICLRSARWVFYLLLGSSEIPPGLEAELPYLVRLFAMWQDHLAVSDLEMRLSRLSYHLLVTEAAFSSIFEPLPVEYFATFLGDVLSEGVFAVSVQVILDEGHSWRPLLGARDILPRREGVFKSRRTAPAPIPVDEEHAKTLGASNLLLLRQKRIHVVLPLSGGKTTLFCFLSWASPPEQEVLHFLSLFAHVASKALEMNALQVENAERLEAISEKIFAVRGLHEASLYLLALQDREQFLTAATDVLGEMTQTSSLTLVTWQPESSGYVLHSLRNAQGGVRRDGRLLVQNVAPVAAETIPFCTEGLSFPEAPTAERLFAAASPFWKERRVARTLFFKGKEGLLGMAGLAPSVTGEHYGDPDTVEILASTIAVGLERLFLLERTLAQKEAAERWMHLSRLLRELANIIHRIRDADLFLESLLRILRNVLRTEDIRLALAGNPVPASAKLLSLAEESEEPRVWKDAEAGEILVVPLRRGTLLVGALGIPPLTDFPLRSVETSELFALLASLVAPHLAELTERAVWRRRNVLDLRALAGQAIREGMEKLREDGIGGVLAARRGEEALSRAQEDAAELVVYLPGKVLALLPFGWTEEMRDIFPSDEGWDIAEEVETILSMFP